MVDRRSNADGNETELCEEDPPPCRHHAGNWVNYQLAYYRSASLQLLESTRRPTVLDRVVVFEAHQAVGFHFEEEDGLNLICRHNWCWLLRGFRSGNRDLPWCLRACLYWRRRRRSSKMGCSTTILFVKLLMLPIAATWQGAVVMWCTPSSCWSLQLEIRAGGSLPPRGLSLPSTSAILSLNGCGGPLCLPFPRPLSLPRSSLRPPFPRSTRTRCSDACP